MRPAALAVAVSAVVLVVAFWNRNAIPANVEYVDAIHSEPLQSPTRRPEFDVVYNDTQYRVEPEFDYDITGMVVSYRHHDGNSRMHRLANDHLNMLDVCVIWGDNLYNPRLDRIDFWNGIFTCNVKTRDELAWQAFDMYKLSNNHLISDRDAIRRQVTRLRIGDQIRIRGYLASYTNSAGGTRGTSTTRLDTGNGACETIYVEQFVVLRPAQSGWRRTMWVALVVLVLSLVWYFSQPYRPYSRSA